jgi:hypothetical protein
VHRSVAVQQEQCDALLVFFLLQINSLYMFQALLAHLQEALYVQQLVNCVHIVLAGCYQGLGVVCAAPPEDEQVVLEICTGC